MKRDYKRELDETTLASVKKELAKPRMARSACKAGMNPKTARISKHASTTKPRIIGKIILSRRPSKPEKVRFVVDETGPGRESPQ